LGPYPAYPRFFETRGQVTSYITKHFFGIGKNPKARVNQQVTKASKKQSADGTSETIREAVSPRSPQVLRTWGFDFSDFEKNKPQHKKTIDHRFLEWFLGFFEGDGYILARRGKDSHGNPKGRVVVEITQSITNIKVLYFIRKKLGFGQVKTYERNGFKYARWSTSKREHIFRLFSIFNGNLILPKRREQFEKIISEVNHFWSLNLQIKPWRAEISLDNAWLSGFTDADGGFSTNIQNNFRMGRKNPTEFYHSFRTWFYITQDGDPSFLHKIQQLLGEITKIFLVHPSRTRRKSYGRLSVTSTQGTEKLISYFTRFPLKGERRISFLRWARVYGYKKRGIPLTEASAARFARLIYNLSLIDKDSEEE
jgi:hypothetical protein